MYGGVSGNPTHISIYVAADLQAHRKDFMKYYDIQQLISIPEMSLLLFIFLTTCSQGLCARVLAFSRVRGTHTHLKAVDPKVTMCLSSSGFLFSYLRSEPRSRGSPSSGGCRVAHGDY